MIVPFCCQSRHTFYPFKIFFTLNTLAHIKLFAQHTSLTDQFFDSFHRGRNVIKRRFETRERSRWKIVPSISWNEGVCLTQLLVPEALSSKEPGQNDRSPRLYQQMQDLFDGEKCVPSTNKLIIEIWTKCRGVIVDYLQHQFGNKINLS